MIMIIIMVIKVNAVEPLPTATSLQWSLSPVPKVAVVERFNCIFIVIIVIVFFNIFSVIISDNLVYYTAILI